MIRNHRYRRIFAVLILAVAPAAAEKKWQGQLSHAPVLGEGLAGARVLFGQLSGRCVHEFGDLLRQDLLANGITVITDTELSALATQHHLPVSAPPSGPSPELARILGPTDVISIDISRCQALPREPIVGSGLPAMHIARTEGHFLASLHVVDLASGKDLVTQTLRADPSKENQSQTGSPEYPSSPELIDVALRQAVGQTRRLYSPWKETQELIFMDDKDCDLRQAWELLAAGDYHGLLRTARENADSCQSPKTAGAAWYDLGVAYMLVQNYDGALSAFGKSQKLRYIRQAVDLIDECRRNKELAQALARQVVAWAQPEADKPPVKEAQTGIVFTNDLVMRLVRGDVADEAIIKMIGSEPIRFSLGPDDLAKLKDAGVSDTIVAAMQARK